MELQVLHSNIWNTIVKLFSKHPVYLFITCIKLDMILMKGLKLITIDNYASFSVMHRELHKLFHVFVELV
jgi:hypothetical protein